MSSIISTPAMVLSARRELVPETNIKSPTRLVCGYAPLGVMLVPSEVETLLFLLLIIYIVILFLIVHFVLIQNEPKNHIEMRNFSSVISEENQKSNLNFFQGFKNS
tara:strand:+ start:13540 stop:13857 length:318 start_codon:yes stop_codon:yes gene_type:complete